MKITITNLEQVVENNDSDENNIVNQSIDIIQNNSENNEKSENVVSENDKSEKFENDNFEKSGNIVLEKSKNDKSENIVLENPENDNSEKSENDVSEKSENVISENPENDVSENNQKQQDENVEEVKKDSIHYDTLVLSGGGIKGFSALGSLQYLYDEFYIHKDKIKNMVGTSIGSIICYLIAIGYTPTEIIAYVCTNQVMESLSNIDFLNIIKTQQTIKFSLVQDSLERMTIDKIGYLPTLENIYTKFGIKLYFVTYNITKSKVEYIGYDNYPNLPCLIGIRMSSSLPFIFEKYKYGNSYYIDGGVVNNFAIDFANEKLGENILGIYTTADCIIKNDDSIFQYFFKLISIHSTEFIKYRISTIENMNRHKLLEIKSDKKSFYDFGINTTDKLELFSDGYEQTKKYFLE